MRVSLDTKTLRELIEPDAVIELERMAAEKVAEELRKKFSSERITSQINNEFDRIMRVKLRDLGSTYSMPAEVKAAIEILSAAAVAKAAEMVIQRISKETQLAIDARFAALDRRLDTIAMAHSTKLELALDDKIKTLARAEFFAVLKEAKGAL